MGNFLDMRNNKELQELMWQEKCRTAQRDSVERKLKAGSTHVTQEDYFRLNDALTEIQNQIEEIQPASIAIH